MMPSPPLVSIVLPTFNGSRFIGQSIESCLAQSHTNWELIVVDDASTDATAEVVASFAVRDSRIRLLKHERNRKLPAALNTGFAAAAGTFLTWTSDDNFYAPDALAVMVDLLVTEDVDVVYADYHLVNEEGEVTGEVVVRPHEELWQGNYVGACFLFRRSVMECTGSYDEGLFLAEDFDYWLRVASRFTMVPVHRKLYYYRDHGMSLSAQQRHRVTRATVAALEKNLPALTWLSGVDRGKAYLAMYRMAGSENRWTLSRCAYKLKALRHAPRYVVSEELEYWSGVISSTLRKAAAALGGKDDR